MSDKTLSLGSGTAVQKNKQGFCNNVVGRMTGRTLAFLYRCTSLHPWFYKKYPACCTCDHARVGLYRAKWKICCHRLPVLHNCVEKGRLHIMHRHRCLKADTINASIKIGCMLCMVLTAQPHQLAKGLPSPPAQDDKKAPVRNGCSSHACKSEIKPLAGTHIGQTHDACC